MYVQIFVVSPVAILKQIKTGLNIIEVKTSLSLLLNMSRLQSNTLINKSQSNKLYIYFNKNDKIKNFKNQLLLIIFPHPRPETKPSPLF